MLDFQAVREKRLTFAELTQDLTIEDLRGLTHEIVDTQLTLIADCTDDDVTFQPVDPYAHDPYAAGDGANAAWTLAHVIVHASASAEEAAFIAAELARGVPFHGRSRYEVPWELVTTIDQCRQRLQESRHMRLASLELWPACPHMEVLYQAAPDKPLYNPIQRFVLGLRHEADHLVQVAEIVRQAHAAEAAVA